MSLKLSLRCSHWVRRWSTIWRSPWHRHTPTTYLHRQYYHQDINPSSPPPSSSIVIIFIKTIVANLLIKVQSWQCVASEASLHWRWQLPFFTIFYHFSPFFAISMKLQINNVRNFFDQLQKMQISALLCPFLQHLFLFYQTPSSKANISNLET